MARSMISESNPRNTGRLSSMKRVRFSAILFLVKTVWLGRRGAGVPAGHLGCRMGCRTYRPVYICVLGGYPRGRAVGGEGLDSRLRGNDVRAGGNDVTTGGVT